MTRLAPILAICLCAGCASYPVTHSIPNFSMVEPGLYRGGEPATSEGWQYLESLGVCKTLRLDYARETPKGAPVPIGIMNVQGDMPPEDLGQLLDVPKQHDIVMRATWIDAAMKRVKIDPLMSQLSDKTEPQVGLYMQQSMQKPCPVFVHCLHGQDRTGLIIAVYRVLFDHWTKARAEKEMLNHGFRKMNHGLWEAWEKFNPSAGDPLWNMKHKRFERVVTKGLCGDWRMVRVWDRSIPYDSALAMELRRRYDRD